MGTFLLGTFCALALVSAPKENPKDTVDVFVIDGKKMEHFDGNCLKNKFIFDYSMSCQDKGKHVERIHEISTNAKTMRLVEIDSMKVRFGLDTGGFKDLQQLKGKFQFIRIDTASVYLEDGKLKKIKVIDIAVKPDEYDDATVIYVIDGKKSTKEDLGNIDPETIKSINIDKGMTTTIYVELKK